MGTVEGSCTVAVIFCVHNTPPHAHAPTALKTLLAHLAELHAVGEIELDLAAPIASRAAPLALLERLRCVSVLLMG